jgi:hypothetical protein
VPGRETAPGFVLSDVSRRDQDLRPASKQGASAHDPGPCSPLDIRCYLRRVAAHVIVFEREISRPCKFRCI